MPIGDAIPTITAMELLRALNHDAVWFARTNPMWQGVLSEGGDSVKILSTPAVSVSDYDPNLSKTDTDYDLTYASLDPGSGVTVTVDQFKSWSIMLEDIHRAQSIPMLMAPAVRQAGATLIEVMDRYARGLFGGVASRHIVPVGTDDGKVDMSAALTDPHKSSVRRAFQNAARLMTQAKIPKAGRWAIVGPVWMQALTETYETDGFGDMIADSTTRNGFAGTVAGIRVYETSQPLAVGSGNTSEDVCFGNDYIAASIVQMQSVRSLVLESRHAEAVRGLAAYGGEVVESDGLFRSRLTYENLPAAA